MNTLLLCGVVPGRFSCLAGFKRPSDGRVGSKMPLALFELTEPVLVSLFDTAAPRPPFISPMGVHTVKIFKCKGLCD